MDANTDSSFINSLNEIPSLNKLDLSPIGGPNNNAVKDTDIVVDDVCDNKTPCSHDLFFKGKLLGKYSADKISAIYNKYKLSVPVHFQNVSKPSTEKLVSKPVKKLTFRDINTNKIKKVVPKPRDDIIDDDNDNNDNNTDTDTNRKHITIYKFSSDGLDWKGYLLLIICIIVLLIVLYFLYKKLFG